MNCFILVCGQATHDRYNKTQLHIINDKIANKVNQNCFKAYFICKLATLVLILAWLVCISSYFEK